MVITYYGGDKVNAGQNYTTQLTLNCDITLASNGIEIDNVNSAEASLEVQGRMYCPKSALPWVETNTYYKDPDCNSFNVYMVTHNNVASCSSGCFIGSITGTSVEVSCERVSEVQ